jgi:hypothetical protein
MGLFADNRGQSVQIGAVLLFGVLIISFSSYQAFVVPDQNRGIEFSHNADVQDEMTELRNTIVSMPGESTTQSTEVTLGTRYPSRAIAINPGPASGTLRTEGTTDATFNLTIENATADRDTGDRWDGSAMNYTTGNIVYDPSYNLYDRAPLTVHENTLLHNQFRSGRIVTANQTFIDGTEISLVVINGSLSRTSVGATSVDVQPISSSSEKVTVTNPASDSPVTLNLTTRLSKSEWERILSDESVVDEVTFEENPPVGSEYNETQITLATGNSYTLQLTKVGVGTGTEGEDISYLTDVSGDNETIGEGETTDITLEVRDRFNNPPDNASDATVFGGVPDAGSLNSSSKTPNADGEVTFTYTAPATGTGDQQVNFSYVGLGGNFDGTTPQNVSVNMSVTASGGSGSGEASDSTFNWKAPDNTNGNGGETLSSCSANACTWEASNSDTLNLNALFTPKYEGVTVDFVLNDTNVGSLGTTSTTTGTNGAATTTLTKNSDGDLTVLAYAGGFTTDIELTLTSSGGGGGNSPSINDVDGFPPNNQGNTYEVDYDVSDPNSDLENVSVILEESDGSNIDLVEVHSPADGTTGSVDGTTTVSYGGNDSPDQVRIIATDDNGNQANQIDSDIENAN